MRLFPALIFVAAVVVAGAAASESPPLEAAAGCDAPDELIAIGPPLTRLAERLAHRQPVTIVALGSSSTQGVGASAPSLSYPSRFEIELRAQLPYAEIRVINRGKGGEEGPQMIERIEREVMADHPDLVIWQLGTNAVLRNDDVTFEEEVIARGLARLKASGSDVVLMDMQFAPRVIARPAYAAMERLLADAAKREHVGLFRRFAIMRWQAMQPAAAPMVGPDGLHMNDRGYGCIAAELAEAVAENWRRQLASEVLPGRMVHLMHPLPRALPFDAVPQY